MVCDENVKGRPGSGEAGYEYCGIAELVQALTKMTAISGNAEAAEIAESMTFNAGQGARLPVLTALSYISHDNRIKALPAAKHHRPAYAAFHNAAACCTLNGGRLLPYYIEAMWLRGDDGLSANLYGPCTVDTEVDGVALTLREETNYPFEDSIRISVDPTKPIKKLQAEAESKETYLKRGPLVYALPIKHDMKESQKETGLNRESGFHLYEITAADPTGWDYTLPANATFESVTEGGDPLHPFADTPIKLKGVLQSATGDSVEGHPCPNRQHDSAPNDLSPKLTSIKT